MRALKISNETTVAELIPMLIDKFKPEMRSMKESVDYSNHYIIMILDGGKLDHIRKTEIAYKEVYPLLVATLIE